MSEDEHRHNFDAKYTRKEGRIEVDSPCVCTGCDQLAFIEVREYKTIVTLVPKGNVVKYSITLSEQDEVGQ